MSERYSHNFEQDDIIMGGGGVFERDDASFYEREDNLSSANSNKFFSRVDTLDF